MDIKQTVEALRENARQMATCKSQVALARLSDRRWDLEARYAMLLRQKGLTPA